MDDLCRCGHGRDAHDHYRAGTDCALCSTCSHFSASTPWWQRSADKVRGGLGLPRLSLAR